MRVFRSGLVIMAFFLPLAEPATAQSLLSSGGLGLPVEPVDARSRSLGGLGLGLFGPTVLPTDPASAADLLVPEVSFTMVQSWVDLEGPAVSSAGGARFPLIGAGYPVSDAGVITLTFGGVLDQRWQAEAESEVNLGGETFGVTDLFASDGGVSAVRLGFSRRIAPSLAVGVTAGLFTGEVSRTFTRSFESEDGEITIPSFTSRGEWGYGGRTLSIGVQGGIGELLRAAGTITWSGDLEASPVGETSGSGAVFSVPTEYRVGVSGALLPSLSLVLGMSYANWEGVVSGLDEGRAALEVGAGVELEQVQLFGWSMPVRLGYRNVDLPFRFDSAESSESAWTGGIGLNLRQIDDVPLARMDFALEAGNRSGGPISESFWRATMTVRVAGN